MAYTNEPFSELDVMNNFMFNKLTSEPEVAEDFCRCLIRNLIGREVSKVKINTEKIELPDNPEKRGVRLDVKVEELPDGECVTSIYDIEPHRDEEKDYPRKNRYSLAQIDKSNMLSGDNDFSHLPEVFIICITNYDPFGYGEMVYTIKKQCIEVPELVYNDGVHIIYFNTKGEYGGTEALRNFLTYLDESSPDNVVDDGTRELNGYVEFIKNNDSIRGTYMTVGEWIDGIVERAVKENLEEAVEQAVEQAVEKAVEQTVEETTTKNNIKAVVNLLNLGIDEDKIKQLYPNEFMEGNRVFLGEQVQHV